jgi:hypothetical protein
MKRKIGPCEEKHKCLKKAKKDNYTAERIQLNWVDQKARPAFLCTNHRLIVQQLVESEFPNLIVRNEAIRKIKDKDHVQTWIFHKDNMKEFDENLEKLKSKYSLLLVGKMLGYITPFTSTNKISKQNNYGTIHWMVGKKRIFCEGLRNLDSNTMDATKEKFCILQSTMPPGFKLGAEIEQYTITKICL